jgi:hypothetical protein
MTKSSPSATARVLMEDTSDPAPASDAPKLLKILFYFRKISKNSRNRKLTEIKHKRRLYFSSSQIIYLQNVAFTAIVTR